jgi:iron(III) transport system ATP-binding protein
MSRIELRGVVKRFGATTVLQGLDLSVPDGSLTAVLGESGSGKTTLLRVIAGFEGIDAGEVTIGGRVVDNGRQSVRAQRRGVGYVPQEGALFPHLTVAANVGFGVPRRERRRVDGLLELVGLAELAKRFPHQLSGGQQQRVALARALAIRPATVLLDEPFSSLDASMRDGVRREVSRILDQSGTTAILVTHDQDEALALADRIAILREGRIVVSAAPRDLYRAPPDLVAATSIGEANIMTATVEGSSAVCAVGTVTVHAGSLDGPARILLRPEQLGLNRDPGPVGVAATVVDVQYHGHDALVGVRLDRAGDDVVLARVPGDFALSAGQTVWVTVRGVAQVLPSGRGDAARKAPTPISPSATAGA